MKEKLPTPHMIRQSVIATKAGEYDKAAGFVRQIADCPVDNFPRWKTFIQQQTMQAASAYVRAEVGGAEVEVNPSMVAVRLRKAQKVIRRIYDNSAVRKAASEVTTDMGMYPYDFVTEMARDRIAYTLTLAHLTGNPEILEQAITLMDGAIESSQDPRVKALISFEREKERVQNDRSGQTFSGLTTAFEEYVSTVGMTAYPEEAARLAAQFSLEAAELGVSGCEKRGIIMYRFAMNSGEMRENILLQEARKKMEAKERYRMWQATKPVGANYELTLSLR